MIRAATIFTTAGPWRLLTSAGWLVVLGLTALSDSISVYIGPSPKEREKEERNDRREKNVQTSPHPHLVQTQ